MKNDDNLSRQPHWRCRLCGHSTPLGQAVCSNPSCRADLGIYGEAVTPGKEEPDRRSWKPQDDEAQRQREETQQRDTEERQRRESAQRQLEEAQRQRAEEQQRKAEEKARREAERQDSRAGDSGGRGAISVLVKLTAGLAAACALLSLVDMVLMGSESKAYFSFLGVPALADAAYCAAICLCCVWCLKTRGARPWPWLSIALAVVGIPLTLWVLDRNYLNGHYGIMLFSHRHYRSVGLPEFLSQAAEKGYLRHVLTKLACVVMAVLGPAAIFLYQRKQKTGSR